MPPFTTPVSNQLSDHAKLLRCVQGIRERSVKAVPWEPDTVGIPEAACDSALARINDLAFYAHARDDVTTLAGVCVDLLGLHRPAGGAQELQHCQGCGLAWPCPTFGALLGLLG